MRVKYNTLPPCNPLFPLPNSRFAAVHPTATCKPAAGRNDAGRLTLNSPARHPFTLCMACPPPTCKGYLSPMELNRKLRYLRNPSTPGRAAA